MVSMSFFLYTVVVVVVVVVVVAGVVVVVVAGVVAVVVVVVEVQVVGKTKTLKTVCHPQRPHQARWPPSLWLPTRRLNTTQYRVDRLKKRENTSKHQGFILSGDL